MKKLYIIAVLIISAVILNACNKDTDLFIPDDGQITGPDSTWYSAIASSMPVNELQQSLLLPPDIDSIEAGDDADTIYSASGLKCIFQPHSCADLTGVPVSGNVIVQSYLLKKKGDLIRMGLPTISNGNLLESGGVFYIHLKKDNGDLQLAPYSSLFIQYGDTAASQQMKLFKGSSSNDGQYNWQQQPIDSSNFLSASNDEYRITTSNLSWINCDHFYGDTTNANKTTVSIKLPPNLTNANTLAYIVFNDIRSVMNMKGDITTKQFITNKVPIGLNVTIITISKDGNFYYLGQQILNTAAPAAGVNSQAITIKPSRLSLDEIKAYLNSL